MLSLVARQLFASCAPAGRGGRLSILIFHRVLAEPDPFLRSTPTAEHFDEVVGWLAEWFNVLPLNVAVERLKRGALPERAAAITFDDGYADNFNVALPVLQRHRVTATFFVATGFLDGGRMWNDTVLEAIRRTSHSALDLTWLGLDTVPTRSVDEKRQAIDSLLRRLKRCGPEERDAGVQRVAEQCGAVLPTDLMMTGPQVRALHQAGMQIGAHTINHPILARCERDRARWEIEEGRSTLEHLIGDRVPLFAYPNGRWQQDYTSDHVRIVDELGFDAAVSTNPGASGSSDDVYQLQRFTPWDRTKWKFALRLGRNLVSRQHT